MINWRKSIIGAALRMSGYPAFKILRFLKSIEYKSPDELQKLQDEKLRALLLHAYKNVPYYNKILAEAGVVKNEDIILENFHRIPVLTKEIMRREGKNLYSGDYKKRGWYYKTSGGSTGEPVTFIQDKKYEAWRLAARFLFNSWLGKDVGEPELQLWGSERDILKGQESLSTRLRRWMFNKTLQNAYKMSQENMREYINQWSRLKPKQVWAYTDSMYKLSKFAKKEQLQVYSPESIICTTANLLPEAREHIERTFGCKVFNQYGSREVGAIACECQTQEGLHIFSILQKLEILNTDGEPVKGEDIGEIIITNLHNYSMPLIRYKIGDTACFLEKPCSCGRGFPLLKEVSGRVFAHFVKRDGSMVHSQFFVALLFFKPWIREFKIVQMDYDIIDILVAQEGEANAEDINTITRKIKQVMGEDCEVKFKFVDEVSPTKSGKFLYTFSEVAAGQE